MEGLEALFYTYCWISLLKVLENNLYFDIALDGLHTGFNAVAIIKIHTSNENGGDNDPCCTIEK